MKSLLRFFVLWFITGVFYYAAEGVWHLGNGGWASIYMMPIGGFCITAAGSLHRIPGWYSMRVPVQALVGAILITAVEYAAGMLFNHCLGLMIWDYSDKVLNLNGQICAAYSLLWFLLMPLTMWLCDWLRYFLWCEGHPYSLWRIYACFGTGKWMSDVIQS